MRGRSTGTEASRFNPSPDGAAALNCSALIEGPDAMSVETQQRLVRVTNPSGFHMRPITAFAEAAQRFQATITVSKDGRRVNGKSPMELLFLAATQGTDLLLEASGPDAEAALRVVAEIVERIPPEDQDPLAALPPKG